MIEVGFEHRASKRQDAAEVMGVYEDFSCTRIDFMKEVDQFPSRTSVKIPCQSQMQISIAPLQGYFKIGIHGSTSVMNRWTSCVLPSVCHEFDSTSVCLPPSIRETAFKLKLAIM